jgi:hypothetical protein
LAGKVKPDFAEAAVEVKVDVERTAWRRLVRARKELERGFVQ